MSDDARPPRRYTEHEVARIIQRASEMQLETTPGDSSAGLTLAELEQVAREAGLDPALVRHAATSVDQHDDVEPSRFIGAPTHLHVERTADGTLVEDDYDPVIAALERSLGESGTASTLGHTLQWTAARVMARGAVGQGMRVTLSPRDGRTTIRLEEPFAQRAEGIFAVLMVAGTFLGASIAAPAFLGAGGPPAAAGAFAGVAGASYWLARSIYGRVVRRRMALLQAAADRLALVVADAAGMRAPRTGPEGPGREA